jgi:hypothetical protein
MHFMQTETKFSIAMQYFMIIRLAKWKVKEDEKSSKIIIQNLYFRSQPFQLPTGAHTLKEANKLGLCFQPNLKSRLQSCRVGLACIDSRRPTFLSVNSCGDVLIQRLEQAVPELNQEHIKNSINTWEETVSKKDFCAPIEPLKVAALWDASKLVGKGEIF